jgi:transposase-like protein
MGQKKRSKKYPASVQQSALERMKLGVNVSELAEQLGVNRSTLYAWKEQAERGGLAGQPTGEAKAEAVEQYNQRTEELEGEQRNYNQRIEEVEGAQRDYRIQELESKLAEMERELGRAELEKRFFKAALRRIEESRQKIENSGATASSPRSATGRTRKAD